MVLKSSIGKEFLFFPRKKKFSADKKKSTEIPHKYTKYYKIPPNMPKKAPKRAFYRLNKAY